MSADILIKTDERKDVIFVPSRTVLTNNGTSQKYVRVLVDGNIEERTVELGLKADNSMVEIINGLEEGEEVILRTIY